MSRFKPVHFFTREHKHFGTYLLLHAMVTVVVFAVLWDEPKTAYNLGTAASGIAAVAGWCFVLRYAREYWEETEAGRHLMVFTSGLTAILTFIFARNFFHLPLNIDMLMRLLIFLFLAVHLVWRLRILLRQTKQGRPIDEAVSQLRSRAE